MKPYKLSGLLLTVLIAWNTHAANVYNYFAPGGALSCTGQCTQQTVDLTAASFLTGPLATSKLPAFSGDCTTPGGSGVLTCTKTNGVAFGPAATIATTTGSGSVVLATSPVLTTPNLGTPSAINLTNATGLPATALPALSGDCTTPGGSGVLTCTKTNGVAFGPAATIATTTGSGSVVLSTSPTLTTPNLGTPSAINLTNATGPLPLSALATCAATQILFATSSTAAACSSKFTWNDSTVTLTVGAAGSATVLATPNAISGNGSALTIRTGNATGAGSGGAFTFTGGIGGTTGTGSTVTFNAGNGGTTSGGGGRLVFNGGNAGPTGNATGGDVDINGGQGAGNGQAGAFNIVGGPGDPGSNGGGGSIGITGGTSGGTGGLGGGVTIQGGSSLGAQAAGDVLIGGGSASGTGANGRVILIDQNFDNALLVDGVGHLSFAVTPPTVSACGTGPSIDTHANDTTGTVTVGTIAAASCTITFATAYTTWVHCRVTSQSVIASFAYSYTLARIVVTGTSLINDKLDYSCDGS